jgi:hypothetical protein
MQGNKRGKICCDLKVQKYIHKCLFQTPVASLKSKRSYISGIFAEMKFQFTSYVPNSSLCQLLPDLITQMVLFDASFPACDET